MRISSGRIAVMAVLVTAMGTLTACSSGPSPRPAANAVAAAFTSGNLATATFADPAAATAGYNAIVSGMHGAEHTVTVAAVKTDDKVATATLDWSWAVGAKPWTYSTSLTLSRAGTVWTPEWSPQAVAPVGSASSLQLIRTAATRGNILDAAGDVLVGPRAVFNVGLDKSQVAPTAQPTSAAALARLVGIDPVAYAASVQANGPQAFVAAITYRSSEMTPLLSAQIHAIPGAIQIAAMLPLAPSKGFAGGILGTVGPATAEVVKASKGRVLAGDQVGTSGLEQRYDASLAGSPEITVKAGATTLFHETAVNGTDLRLNLNLTLQNLADGILSNVGPGSALVAIQPSTGKVLAVSDGPGSNGYPDATIGQFPPGSTFKTVTSLALFREGLTPNSTVPCTPSITVAGKVFTNDSLYPPSGIGQIPLRLAYANSCNTAYISQTPKLKPGDLADAAAALGFGVDMDTGYGSYFGQVPPASGETEAAADMIGQGKILASPLAMATVLSSVVAGHAVIPALIAGLTLPARTPAHPLTAAEADLLRGMLRGVVTTPTGTGAGLANLAGAPVLAKTGTAEFQNGATTATHAWMMGAQGDLAVAVFVNVGQTGAGVAGPLLKRFLQGAQAAGLE